MTDLNQVIERQSKIAKGTTKNLPALPKHKSYAICNLRGGVGKTTLTVNLAYSTEDVLVVDTCPQGNTSAFFDEKHYTNANVTVLDMIMPYLVPGLGKAQRVAIDVAASNASYKGRNVFYVPSSEQLYLLPNQINTALNQAGSLTTSQRSQAVTSILNSLRSETEREASALDLTKILIDCSPFFSGATQLAWHAADALVVPVRTDQQSINSLNMLLRLLSDSNSEFRKAMVHSNNLSTPKIQMVAITHCGWSTAPGAENEPNNPTKIYLEKVYDIVRRHIQHFSTNDPANHILILDDFLGSGRFSSATSRPIQTLSVNETVYVNRVKVTVNGAVKKCQNQLNFLARCLW